MQPSFKISSSDLEASLERFYKEGMTEFTLQDPSVLESKAKLLKFLQFVEKNCPGLFVTLPLSADVLDMDICKECSRINCSLDILLSGVSKNNNYLFDKKFYSRRAQMLNTLGLLFGFSMDFASASGDNVRAFRDRLNFAVSLYPNHIEFPQLDKDSGCLLPRPSAVFSTQDIRIARETAFACEVFYTLGRAVTWFLAALRPLKMTADKFFKDFAEWQNHNNCGLLSNWNSGKAGHREIERMQLSFLEFKYEEKGKSELFEAVSNIVRLNGALSRCYGEGEESIVELSYNPDELLSGGAMEIQSFFDNSFMERCRVKVYFEDGEAKYHYA